MEIVKQKDLNSDMDLFSVSGKIDANTSHELEKRVCDYIRTEKKPFGVDMSSVSYISSAGLRVLLIAQKEASAAGVTMTIMGVQKQVMDVFKMSGLAGTFKFA